LIVLTRKLMIKDAWWLRKCNHFDNLWLPSWLG